MDEKSLDYYSQEEESDYHEHGDISLEGGRMSFTIHIVPVEAIGSYHTLASPRSLVIGKIPGKRVREIIESTLAENSDANESDEAFDLALSYFFEPDVGLITNRRRSNIFDRFRKTPKLEVTIVSIEGDGFDLDSYVPSRNGCWRIRIVVKVSTPEIGISNIFIDIFSVEGVRAEVEEHGFAFIPEGLSMSQFHAGNLRSDVSRIIMQFFEKEAAEDEPYILNNLWLGLWEFKTSMF